MKLWTRGTANGLESRKLNTVNTYDRWSETTLSRTERRSTIHFTWHTFTMSRSTFRFIHPASTYWRTRWRRRRRRQRHDSHARLTHAYAIIRRTPKQIQYSSLIYVCVYSTQPFSVVFAQTRLELLKLSMITTSNMISRRTRHRFCCLVNIKFCFFRRFLCLSHTSLCRVCMCRGFLLSTWIYRLAKCFIQFSFASFPFTMNS